MAMGCGRGTGVLPCRVGGARGPSTLARPCAVHAGRPGVEARRPLGVLMREIRPIPTRHAGVTFRSRLEARWARFFDALGLRWEYEPQGFQLPSGDCYLPDFWLPGICCYVEVKPVGGDFGKARELAAASGKPVWLAEGLPSDEWQKVAGGEWPCAHIHTGKGRLWWGCGEEESGPFDSGDVRDAASAARTERFGT